MLIFKGDLQPLHKATALGMDGTICESGVKQK